MTSRSSVFAILKEVGESILHFIYPQACIGCFEQEPIREDIFCLDCKLDLPFTTFFEVRNNDMEMRLKGRFPLIAATAIFYFYKEGKIQNCIHQLKYNRKRVVGEKLGQRFASLYKASPSLETPDYIVPVPLHEKRRAQRGYNQSEVFARAISEGLDIPVIHLLKKSHFTESQTAMSRENRLKNIADSMQFQKGKTALEGKHLLLVDDVLTTGATLEACASILLKNIKNCRLSVGTIAIAESL